MNLEEKAWIRSNLVLLIKQTICHAELLSILESNEILGPSDTECLETLKHQPFEQSRQLYRILETRQNSYTVLLEALKQTRQSGAVAILSKEFQNERKHGAISINKSQLLGKGSHCTKVYQGKFENNVVAVKVLERDQVDLKQATEEIVFLQKLDHENILRLFHMESDDDHIYIALELCWLNLQDEMNKKLVNIASIDIIRKVTSGVAYLHLNNIIHRDLKPTNILLKENSQLKISDFGLSKQIPVGASSVTIHSGVVGTAEWMAPELWQAVYAQKNSGSFKVKPSSDIFALGCIYFFVLSNGKHLFGNDPVDIQYNIRKNRRVNHYMIQNKYWNDLIKTMTYKDFTNRPKVSEVLNESILGLRTGTPVDLNELSETTMACTDTNVDSCAPAQEKPNCLRPTYCRTQ